MGWKYLYASLLRGLLCGAKTTNPKLSPTCSPRMYCFSWEVFNCFYPRRVWTIENFVKIWSVSQDFAVFLFFRYKQCYLWNLVILIFLLGISYLYPLAQCKFLVIIIEIFCKWYEYDMYKPCFSSPPRPPRRQQMSFFFYANVFFYHFNILIMKITVGAPEVRSDKFSIWHLTQDNRTNGPMD